MAQTESLLTAQTATGAGATFAVPPERSKRSFCVSLTGTGSVTATVDVEVSNDNGTTWVTRMTFTLSGTALDEDTDVDECAPFPLVRGNVVARTGTGAAVSLSMCAA